jgi:hypothetical protein
MVNMQPIHNSSVDEPQRDQCPNGVTPVRRVRQDKGAEYRARIASSQPASPTRAMRAHALKTNTPRSQNKPKPKRQTVQLTIWLKPRVKAELQRIAMQETLSISATGAVFLEKAIQSSIHEQHGALLERVITQAIGRSMRAYSNRLVLLLVRVAFESSQTRSIVTNILSRQPGVTPEVLNTILDGSAKTAKRNITRRTPQLEAIIEEFGTLFQQGEEEAS